MQLCLRKEKKKKKRQCEIDIQVILFQLFQTFASPSVFMLCSTQYRNKIFTHQDKLKTFWDFSYLSLINPTPGSCGGAFGCFYFRLAQMHEGWCCVLPQPDVLAPAGCPSGALWESSRASPASLTNVQTTVQPLLPEQVV